MSSFNNKKCCKVCRDSGKPEAIFTSHYVKDSRNGVIVCPTLLATVCRYCKQNGHTAKYCSSVKNYKVTTLTPLRIENAQSASSLSLITARGVGVLNVQRCKEPPVKVVNLQVNTRVNRYGALSDESDNEDIPIPKPPVLLRQSAINAVTIPKRWVDYDSDSDIEQEI
jgi:hypothetical protein